MVCGVLVLLMDCLFVLFLCQLFWFACTSVICGLFDGLFICLWVCVRVCLIVVLLSFVLRCCCVVVLLWCCVSDLSFGCLVVDLS